jgi:hypothetical protein
MVDQKVVLRVPKVSQPDAAEIQETGGDPPRYQRQCFRVEVVEGEPQPKVPRHLQGEAEDIRGTQGSLRPNQQTQPRAHGQGRTDLQTENYQLCQLNLAEVSHASGTTYRRNEEDDASSDAALHQ